MRIFALTTRGLEEVSAAEMGRLTGIELQELAYRRLAASYSGAPADLLTLRTVDDVYLWLATWKDIGRHRSTLDDLRTLAATIDLAPAVRRCEQVREVGRQPIFSVTASFVGRRNYAAPEIKVAISRGIAEAQGWLYSEDDGGADLNIRLFIERDVAQVGLRLGKTPLHRRAYKRAQMPGSLKPPVAAAMVALAEAPDGALLLDPCCGVGTIAIEAAYAGYRTIAGDIAPKPLWAAHQNASLAEQDIPLLRWDAGHLPLARAAVDVLVTNLPWGRQVTSNTDLRRFYRRVCREMERVLRPGGRAVVLTALPEWLRFKRLALCSAREISLYGQNPTITVFGGP